MREWDVERFYIKTPSIISNHSRCEVCEHPVNEHEWIDLDDCGCVVACSNDADRTGELLTVEDSEGQVTASCLWEDVTPESTYGDCGQCGFPLDPNGDCGTDITHNY